MRSRRTFALIAAAALVSLFSPDAGTSSPSSSQPVVVEGFAVSFAMRPTYDSGGAAPLHTFIGYTDANISNPDASADGQASWYNFAIAETAAFRPPEQCTPHKNAEHTAAGIGDVHRYLEDYIGKALSSITDGKTPPRPTVPGPRHACTERLPGFAQSRYPETETIRRSASDSYLDKPAAAAACRDDPGAAQCRAYRDHWPAYRGAAGAAARDGAFSAEADATPAQRSNALLFGAGDGRVVSIGLARTRSEVDQNGDFVNAEAVAVLDDVCIGVTADGCSLHIARVKQIASVRKAPGKRAVVAARTVVVGVTGARSEDIDADELMLGQAAVDFGGYFQIQAVSRTDTCSTEDPDVAVADAGGIRIFGKGGQGGGIMIGGACARARAEFVPRLDAGPVGVPEYPPRAFDIPPELFEQPQGGAVGLGPPRVVTREVVKEYYQDAVAWRTMPYWSSVLGMLIAGSLLGRRYRDATVVRPVARALDRISRQFLKG